MCFVPQGPALFPHLNFQERSGAEVFCTSKFASHHNGVHLFDISFLTLSHSKKLLSGWGWGALYILTLTLKGASCHNCMQLFNSHLHRWLRNRRFSEPTFRPSGILEPQVIGKRQWIYRYFSTFLGPESSFFIFLLLLILSLLSDNFLSSSSLLFSEASTSNCFSICPYCQKFDF